MSIVKMTVRQITDLGLWDKVCEYKGWNPWIKNEGQIDSDEIVEFDSEFKKDDASQEKSILELIEDQIIWTLCKYEIRLLGSPYTVDDEDITKEILDRIAPIIDNVNTTQ